jgi:hypothetical protein
VGKGAVPIAEVAGLLRVRLRDFQGIAKKAEWCKIGALLVSEKDSDWIALPEG